MSETATANTDPMEQQALANLDLAIAKIEGHQAVLVGPGAADPQLVGPEWKCVACLRTPDVYEDYAPSRDRALASALQEKHRCSVHPDDHGGWIAYPGRLARLQRRGNTPAIALCHAVLLAAGFAHLTPEPPPLVHGDTDQAFDLGFEWRQMLMGHVHDGRDVARTLTAVIFDGLDFDKHVIDPNDRVGTAIVKAKCAIKLALVNAAQTRRPQGL